MRVPLSDARSSERADAAMTPMIDVVFLLLIFFLWTASFQAAEALLPSQLTEAAASGTGVDDLPQEDFEQIVVRVELQGDAIAWRINQQSIETLSQVSERLKLLASIRSDLPVVIDPALDVEFGHVIDVYDVARQVGMANIQFTTRADAAPN